jgi:hypothetical protein
MPFIGNKPAQVPLTSADITDSIITSAKIVDGTIANADIANSTINLTTKVTGTLPVANGGTGLATLGTAAQELRVNSGATALEYYTPTVASSDFVKLATGTISSQTSISFDGYFTSAYDIYKFFIYDCTLNNTANAFSLRFRRSNADVTTSNYRSVINGAYWNSATGGQALGGLWDGTSIKLHDSSYSTDSNYKFVCDLTLYNPLGTSAYKMVTWETMTDYESINWYSFNGSGVLKDSTSALSGITFLRADGSSITAGKFALYGVKI